MTCQEFRDHFEDRGLAGPEIESAVADHAATCEVCARMMEEERNLGTSLRLLRESVPQVPASLDAAILANYRSYAARNMHSRPARSRRRISLFAAVAWTAAVAAALIIAAAELRLFLPSEEAVISTVPSALQIQAAAKTATPPSEPRLTAGNRASATVAKSKRKMPSRHVGKESSSVAATRAADTFPIGFRGLMYCDALSCGGPMEMIRVQLPPSAAGLAPAWTSADQVVYADVLVGPDGIARGIRIVQ